jgi:hypothetical protein
MPTLVASDKLYASSANPQWVRLLESIDASTTFRSEALGLARRVVNI